MMNDKDQKIKELEKRIVKLEDENESLWDMLDETAKSDVDNWTHLIDKLKVDMITRALMVSKKKVDA